MDRFFYKLIILLSIYYILLNIINLFYYVMQNPIQKFRQSAIVFEKPGIWSENLKTSYPRVSILELQQS